MNTILIKNKDNTHIIENISHEDIEKIGKQE